MIGITYLRFCKHSYKTFLLSVDIFPRLWVESPGRWAGWRLWHLPFYIPALCWDVCGFLVRVHSSCFFTRGHTFCRSVIFILVSGISVFWNFNGPDFVAACMYPIHLITNLASLYDTLRYKFANLCFVIRRLESNQENKDSTFLFSCRACLSTLNTPNKAPIIAARFYDCELIRIPSYVSSGN
jgi:hypothetical protein